MKTIFLFLIFLILNLGCSSMKTNQKNNIELADEFVVLAFGGPTLKHTNLKSFQEIADANIDIIMPGNQSDDRSSNLKALDLVEKAGIRMLT